MALGLVVAIVLTCSFSSFAAVCGAIRQDTLRLHILANSDSEADQALKLEVRDAILEQAGDLFDGAQDKQQADAYLELYCERADEAVQIVRGYLPIVAASELARHRGGKNDEFLMSWIDVFDYQ